MQVQWARSQEGLQGGPGGGQAGRLQRGRDPRETTGVHPCLRSHTPSTLRRTDTPRHSHTHPHTPSSPLTRTTPFRSCGLSALPTLLSSLSTARGQSHVQSLAPLFRQHHPGMVPLVRLREVWPRRRGRGLSHLSEKPRSHIQPSKKNSFP